MAFGGMEQGKSSFQMEQNVEKSSGGEGREVQTQSRALPAEPGSFNLICELHRVSNTLEITESRREK